MEKRNTTRVPFHVRAVIAHDNRSIEGEVKNLSTGGILVRTDEEAIPTGSSVQVSIFLYGSSSSLTLNMAGKVVRAAGGEIAVQFTELDLDSFIHLRNIVARNATDDEAILEEYRRFKPEGERIE